MTPRVQLLLQVIDRLIHDKFFEDESDPRFALALLFIRTLAKLSDGELEDCARSYLAGTASPVPMPHSSGP